MLLAAVLALLVVAVALHVPSSRRVAVSLAVWLKMLMRREYRRGRPSVRRWLRIVMLRFADGRMEETRERSRRKVRRIELHRHRRAAQDDAHRRQHGSH